MVFSVYRVCLIKQFEKGFFIEGNGFRKSSLNHGAFIVHALRGRNSFGRPLWPKTNRFTLMI